MGDRYWVWTGARLLAALVVLVWAVSYLGPGSGEKEFQKTLDAMKQVHSFRVAYSGDPGTQHNEALWEVDCDHDILHQQFHYVDTSRTPPLEVKNENLHVGGRDWTLQKDGTWATPKYGGGGGSAKAYCAYLAQGMDTSMLPQISSMIRRGILQKGDKKTVNGVRCREWKVTMKGGVSGLEHDTLCLGLEDHLPYEMTVDWERSRTTYSDYNTSLQIYVPEAALQPASTNTGSN